MVLNLIPRPGTRFRKCLQCDKLFAPKRLNGTFCSKQCSCEKNSLAGAAAIKAKALYKPKTRKDGYVRIYDKETGTWVYEHRYVMEQYLDRKLMSTEVVHHINENPSDNRIENLALCASLSDHIKTHHAHWGQGTPKPWLRRPHIPCIVCGTEFKAHKRDGREVLTCSTACSNRRRTAFGSESGTY